MISILITILVWLGIFIGIIVVIFLTGIITIKFNPDLAQTIALRYEAKRDIREQYKKILKQKQK